MTCLIKSLRLFVLFAVSLFSFHLSAQQTQKVLLSGSGEDQTVMWDFFCTAGSNSGKWTSIPVPSNWELQGFGKYNYGFSKDSSRGMEQGLYKHAFQVPANWKGKMINLIFEGSMTDTEVKINGQSAGPVHQGSYYRFKYNISSLLAYGDKNLLEVTVSKHSKNESVNQAERRGDFWIFGGIFRPVYLEILPAYHIENIALDANAKKQFTATVVIAANSKATNISAQIFTVKGVKTGPAFSAFIKPGANTVSIKASVPSALLWTAETPHLYKVVLTLYENGRILHSVTERFGFRTVELRERDGVYINNVKVKFKGVNRHSFWPTTGRTLSKKLSLKDALLLKDMNMNAVRMSHYPGDDHWYDVCDSLGIFVLDELAGWHGDYDSKTGAKLTRALIEKNGNHPSVVMWANGNEGGHNYELDTLFQSLDIQRRPLLHAWENWGGFDTQHYREYNYGIGNYEHGHDIVMPTEFLHGMYDGGHGAGLQDYWEAMWHNPLSAGGFLWDFADQGVVRKDKNDSIDTDKNRGADGIVGPYRQKEGSYFAIKEVWSPVHIERKEITTAFDGVINLENRYHFSNMNTCIFTYSFKNLQDTSKVSSNGTIVSPNIKAGDKGSIKITLPKNWMQHDVLYLSAFDATKKEIFTWSFPITKPADLVNQKLVFTGNIKPEIREQDSLYFIKAVGLAITINKNNGQLLSVKNDKGIIPINNGPVLQEGVNNIANCSYSFDGNNLVVSSMFEAKNNYNTIKWTIYPTGIIKLQVNYFPAEYFTSMAGVNFSFPEAAIKGVEFMGNGPYRVWKNRMKGNQLGIWKKAYNNTETGEQWNYPEFKGYHSNMYWCKFLTTTQPFTVYTENEDLFFRLFTPAWKTDQWHNYEPIFPTGDISFMQGISSIGTKTQRNETTGPMGSKNIYYDYEKDPRRSLKLVLYFDFNADR
ncbi:MAG: glycoside hydrolase family 2 TIM barrel-domain containing protein [Bacteroidota bacterium]